MKTVLAVIAVINIVWNVIVAVGLFLAWTE